MTRKLIVHIGHYKTGTTALQVFCSNNSDLLLQNGINYSEVHRTNCKHSRFAFGLLKAAGVTTLMHGFSNDEAPELAWQRLFDDVRANEAETTLISSEEFMRIAVFPETAERLKQIYAAHGLGIEVKVVVYLRPVEAQLRSWYNQMVKMNQVIGDLDHALADGSLEAVHYDYDAALRPWIEIFGTEALDIRRYPAPGSARTALFDDFFEMLGFVPDLSDVASGSDVNPRMDDRMLDAVRLAQNTGLRKPVARNLRDRVAHFVEAQDALTRGAGGVDMANERVRTGLAALSKRIGSDLTDLGGPISPRPTGPDLDAVSLQVGYLTKETVRLTRELEQMSARLADAEKIGRRQPRGVRRVIKRILGR